jgi:hypothetical protein
MGYTKRSTLFKPRVSAAKPAARCSKSAHAPSGSRQALIHTVGILNVAPLSLPSPCRQDGAQPSKGLPVAGWSPFSRRAEGWRCCPAYDLARVGPTRRVRIDAFPAAVFSTYARKPGSPGRSGRTRRRTERSRRSVRRRGHRRHVDLRVSSAIELFCLGREPGEEIAEPAPDEWRRRDTAHQRLLAQLRAASAFDC